MRSIFHAMYRFYVRGAIFAGNPCEVRHEELHWTDTGPELNLLISSFLCGPRK
jgi:hypothetical protein